MKYQARDNYIINWPEYPILRISLCFIVGIVVSDQYDIPLDFNFLGLVLFLMVVVFVTYSYQHTRIIIRMLSCSILIIAFSLGLLRGDLQKSTNRTFHYSKYVKDDNIIVGRFYSELKKKKRSSATIEVLQINGNNTVGKLLIYFSEADDLLNYQKGDIISCRGRIQPFKDTTNPLAFNYKEHLKYKGVDAQMFLKDSNHTLLGKERSNLVVNCAYKIRKWAVSIFEKRLKEKDELATASAMVLGYREHLSEELYISFSETGAVHVLAVSGLHVGIICMIFIVLFNRFQYEHVLFKTFKLIILLTVVWTYTLVTGASPAVMRAAVMFSLILIGRLWFEGVNVYNILAFSAMILLMYDPYLLFQLSFQFSYLALISIIYFQPRLERLYDTKHWVATKIWQLTTVSIAAQILVFPISIFYFHKFPTYFILSGVAAVFLATFILGLGLMLLCVDKISFIGDLFTSLYSGLLDGFLRIILWIQGLPYNNVDDVYISTHSVVVLYVAIGTLMFILSLRPKSYKDVFHKKLGRKRIAKWMLASCIIILLCNNIAFAYRVGNLKEMIVYDISKATAIDIFYGNQLFTLATDSIDLKKLSYACQAYHIYNGNPNKNYIEKGKTISFKGLKYDGSGLLSFDDKQIVLANEVGDKEGIPCFSDLILVTHGTSLEPKDILKDHFTNKVVLDNSIDYKLKKKWIEECKERKISIHDVYKSGIFRIKP